MCNYLKLMGNRSGCSLFNSPSSRTAEDRHWVDGLSESENRILKELFTNMKMTGFIRSTF